MENKGYTFKPVLNKNSQQILEQKKIRESMEISGIETENSSQFDIRSQIIPNQRGLLTDRRVDNSVKK
jgi:hypothetical protein